jgi:hypothetical protein
VEKCADVHAPACFSNDDCGDPASRCSVPANSDPTTPIACCLRGPRGIADAGAACDASDTCQSAVCAYTLSGPVCSGPCQVGSSAAQCPASLPTCVALDAGPDASIVHFCGLPP